MQYGVKSFGGPVVYKSMQRYLVYFHGHNLVCKKILDLQSHNRTIIGFSFGMIAKTIKASVYVVRLSFRLRQITHCSALIVLAVMLNLIQ